MILSAVPTLVSFDKLRIHFFFFLFPGVGKRADLSERWMNPPLLHRLFCSFDSFAH